jgi:hypothetical protein
MGGAVIVLTDGQKQVWLDTQKPLDLETDNPELEADLLKAIDGPFTLYSSENMRSIGERIIKGKGGECAGLFRRPGISRRILRTCLPGMLTRRGWTWLGDSKRRRTSRW